MKDVYEYGLELTNNSKTGWAFSLPRAKTCINATDLCRALCYGNGIRYQSKTHKAKRERNFKTCEFLLDEGGPELLTENLLSLIDQARPKDWLAARIKGTDTAIPWTLRIHDVGDFHSVRYVRAWQLAAEKRPECSFWFYTRSFLTADVFEALTELAALKNCQGWLSLDAENYEAAILAKCRTPAGVWKLALLQDASPEIQSAIIPALSKNAITRSSASLIIAPGTTRNQLGKIRLLSAQRLSVLISSNPIATLQDLANRVPFACLADFYDRPPSAKEADLTVGLFWRSQIRSLAMRARTVFKP